MKAVSESRPRAAPVLPASGVSRRSWRGLALVNVRPFGAATAQHAGHPVDVGLLFIDRVLTSQML